MSDYNFDWKLTTKHYTIEVDTKAEYGYFEHNELGDESGGGLWFKGKELIDYDGVFELPREVCQILMSSGFDVTYALDDDSPELCSKG